MSGGCAYNESITAKQAAARLRELAAQLERGGLGHLSVSVSFSDVAHRIDYFGAGYRPNGGACVVPISGGGIG